MRNPHGFLATLYKAKVLHMDPTSEKRLGVEWKEREWMAVLSAVVDATAWFVGNKIYLALFFVTLTLPLIRPPVAYW